MDDSVYSDFCAALEHEGRRRDLRALTRGEGATVTLGGRMLADFSSNDYLGLSRHPALIARARAWTEQAGTGAGSSRLVAGTLELHARIEEKLARFKRSEAALVMGSGYQTNASVLAALLDRHVLGAPPLVFSDRLNHASIHFGCAAAGVGEIRFRHGDLGHLEDQLRRREAEKGRRFILSETVFSMDGDRADVGGLVALAERFGAFLYLDEAHATGILGPGGRGLAADYAERVDLVMGTFSKAMGSYGSYVACSQAIRDYLVNRCGGFIYSTALPPPVLGAIDAALDLMPELDAERAYVAERSAWLRTRIAEAGLSAGASSTQIVPVVVGDDRRAMDGARALEAAGLLAVAIRSPTVPRGTARIRLSLGAAHKPEAIAALAASLPRILADSSVASSAPVVV